MDHYVHSFAPFFLTNQTLRDVLTEGQIHRYSLMTSAGHKLTMQSWTSARTVFPFSQSATLLTATDGHRSFQHGGISRLACELVSQVAETLGWREIDLWIVLYAGNDVFRYVATYTSERCFVWEEISWDHRCLYRRLVIHRRTVPWSWLSVPLHMSYSTEASSVWGVLLMKSRDARS